MVRHGEHREGVLRGAHKSHSMEGADTGLSGTELCLLSLCHYFKWDLGTHLLVFPSQHG